MTSNNRLQRHVYQVGRASRTFACMAALSVCTATVYGAQRLGEKKLVPTRNLDKVIGTLKWSVKEVSSGKVLSKGNKTIRLRDVVIGVQSNAVVGLPKTSGSVSYSAYISLGGHFMLCRPENPESSAGAVSGFGLTLDRDDRSTFSWEWFQVDSPTRATKLQETGQLGIALSKTPRGYSVSRTEFLTDVSLRTLLFSESPDTVHWRTTISKSSVINWPTVRNGQVEMN